MRRKNIILIGIVFIIVIVCILAAVIGFGLSDEKKNDEKDTVKLSQNVSSGEKDSKEDETTSDTDTEKDAVEKETTEKATENETSEKPTKTETTREETTKEEVTEEETTKVQDTVVDKTFDRLSYEYMMIDGKTVYSEFNAKLTELYESINKVRSEAGMPELMFDTEVSYIACARASQIAYEKELDSSQGLKYYDLMQKSGMQFSKSVENTAAGYNDAREVVYGEGTSWKTSTKHYENMISDKYTKVGVGVDYSETMGYVWVAIFLN